MGHRRTPTPASALVAVAVAFGLAGCATGGLGGGSAASCTGPSIELQESSLHPGGAVQLTADWIWETCEDTGGTSGAASDVTVTITPSLTGEEIVLGRPEPIEPRFTVSGSFDLPADLPAGSAVLAVRTHSGDRISAVLPITISTEPPS